MWLIDKIGELDTISDSVVGRGVRSSSEFSEMVSPISTWPPKLRYGSSDDLLKGLRRRPGGPSGLEGRADAAMKARPAESGVGEECARVICGAAKELADDLDLRWVFLKGELLRGRKAKVGVTGFEKVDKAFKVGDSGAVTRRGISGRESSSCSGIRTSMS